MNERIKEFWDKAAESTAAFPSGQNNSWETQVNFMEKFSELIVRECARVARATPAPNFHEHLKQQLGHTWDMAAIEAGREIVKHFGIE